MSKKNSNFAAEINAYFIHMARLSTRDHLFADNEYEVSKDDYSKSRTFTDYDSARAYYEYLQSEEVQDSIAKNQAAAVAQNKEIIANQQRLIEAQERNSRILHRPPVPPVTRQILDPEYKEWLRFQKETNPEFKKWKREQEAAAAREEARRAAERADEEARIRAQWEEAENRRRRQQEVEEEMRRKEFEDKISNIEERLVRGDIIELNTLFFLAQNTTKQNIIDILKNCQRENVLTVLLKNENIKQIDSNYITNQIEEIHRREKAAYQRLVAQQKHR